MEGRRKEDRRGSFGKERQTLAPRRSASHLEHDMHAEEEPLFLGEIELQALEQREDSLLSVHDAWWLPRPARDPEGLVLHIVLGVLKSICRRDMT